MEKEAKAEIKALEATARVARAHIVKFMGDAAVGDFGEGEVIRRKVAKRKAYTVEVPESEFIDIRYGKLSKAEGEALEAQEVNEQQGEDA